MKYAIGSIHHQALEPKIIPISYRARLHSTIGKSEELERVVHTLEKLSSEVTLLRNALDASLNQKKQILVKKLAVPTKNGLEFIRMNSIIRCQADGSYAHIHCVEGRTFVISKTLKHVNTLLDGENFCRIHQSHIVNLDFVKTLRKSEGYELMMIDGDIVPISRSYKDDVNRKLGI